MKRETRPIAEICKKEIINRYGKEILQNQQRTRALLMDFAPGRDYEIERRRMNRALTCGAVDVLLKACEDPAGAELYYKEALSWLIRETDMDTRIARETMQQFVVALSISLTSESERKAAPKTQERPKPSAPQVAETPNAPIDTVGIQAISKKRQWYKSIWLWLVVGAALLGIGLTVFIEKSAAFSWNNWQWIIGIGGALVLTAAAIVVSALVEDWIYNERYETLIISIGVFFLLNFVLRCIFGVAHYDILFHIFSVWLATGAIANAIYAYGMDEPKWSIGNIAAAVVCIAPLIRWPGTIPWATWQWVIGIGGGIALIALALLFALFLETFGPEIYQTLSIVLLLLTIANFALLFTKESQYMTIAICFLAIFTVGAVILACLSFGDYESGFGWLNVILALANGGAFLILAIWSYDTLRGLLTPFENFVSSKAEK